MQKKTFLTVNSEHPTSLKSNIPYNQDLRIKRIFSTAKDSKYQNKEVKERFVKQVNNHELINKPIHKYRS